jgi:ATP-dependent RNA helicase DeaD
MFEMGFIEDVKDIISYLPKNRQTLLFSATISKEVIDISNNYMKNPIKVKMPSYVDKSKLIQNYYRIDQRDKFSLLVNLLDNTKGLIIIFCATRRIVDELSKNLYKQKFKVQALHGGLSQNKRKQVMEDFHANKLDILVASDIAARGLDIKNVQLVINYDIPKTSRDYVHRIGRTARAGSDGKIVSLLTPRDEDNFRTVLEDRSLLVHQLKVPQFEKIFYVRSENRRNDNRRESRRPTSPRFARRY